MKKKILIILIILIALGVGGFFVYSELKSPEIKMKEICEKAGGDLCTEQEICLRETIDLEETGRCCSMDCVIPKEATAENMVLIPAGSFIMGREDREGWFPMSAPEAWNDELPPHEVYVDAFYIDKYEVTNKQFKEFIDATGYITGAEDQGGSSVMVSADQAETPVLGTDIGWKWIVGTAWYAPEGPGSNILDKMDYPVVHVSWRDADAYAKWAGKRLPTEAEWEKAARGGTKTNWFWGDMLGNAGKYANLYGEHRKDYIYPSQEGQVYDGYSETAPVGSLRPNQFGLYDTAGNVFEWVADWYQYDYFKNSPRDNPQGPMSGTEAVEEEKMIYVDPLKVIKGGCWFMCECYLRPANRQPTEISSHNHGIGFRLALDAE